MREDRFCLVQCFQYRLFEPIVINAQSLKSKTLMIKEIYCLLPPWLDGRR